MRAKAIAVIVFGCMLCPLRGYAGGCAYRVVSDVRQGQDRHEVARITRQCRGRGPASIDLSNLASNPIELGWPLSLALSGGYSETRIVFSDSTYPDVPALVRMSARQDIKLSGGGARVYSVEIYGELKQETIEGSDAVSLRDLGASLVSMSGRGGVIIEKEAQKPMAGYFHIVRRIVPELWRQAEKDDQPIEVNAAWVVIP